MADAPEKSKENGKPAQGERPPHRRRDFFGQALREAMAPLAGVLSKRITPLLNALEELPRQAEAMANGVGVSLDQPQSTPRDIPLPQSSLLPERILRPPGAALAGEFEQVCSRGGDCVRACPANAIRIDSSGVIAGGLPYIVAADQPCVVCESLACMKGCASGALKLVDVALIRMGTAKVNHTTCLRSKGEDCRLCITACPLGDKAIVISEESGKVRVKRDGCIGCGLCESRCPTEPRAITVIPFKAASEPMIA